MSTYTVNTDIFQGPFDLLLHLVSNRKLDVHALVLADIVDEYIAHIETMRELDLEVASEFLVLAAQLLEIKGATLLPKGEVYVDEEFEELTPHEMRDILVARLIAYKQFKNIADWLDTRLEAQSRQHPRRAELEPAFSGVVPDFLEGITLHSLALTYVELQHRRELFLLEADHVASMPISLESYAQKVRARLQAGVSKTFAQLLGKGTKREEVVVTFLAVLELYKRGMIDMSQEGYESDLCLVGLSQEQADARGIVTEAFDEY